MRHRLKGRKLSRKHGHRKALIRNLATSLILYEKIMTTAAKAKSVKGEVEKMINIGKRGDLHSRRLLLRDLPKIAVLKIIEDLSVQFKNKKYGFIRLVKIDNRPGDNASRVLVELLVKHKEEERKGEKEKIEKEKRIIETTDTRQEKKPGFWDRFRGRGPKIKELRKPSKKTIERTTSK